jgi:MYXO-CTERM domain-containing protein
MNTLIGTPRLSQKIQTRRTTAGLAAVTSSLLAASSAHAYLGGFELQDGYGGFLSEVRQTNEGQYGTNNGGPGGVQTPITPGTGLWYGIAGTMYPAFSSNGTAYATGHAGFQHTGNQALVITTGCDGWGGPALKYGYRLDSRDLNGTPPAATAGQTVNVSFWTRPYLDDAGVTPGTVGDTVEFVDSAGNVGFSVGVHQPGSSTDYVAYRNSGTYTLTSMVAASFIYSRWDIKLDLAAQTVTAGYYDGATNTFTSLLTNAPLAATMSDLNRLYFTSSAGVSNSKNWAVDDFVMSTTAPAPSALALIGLGGLGLTRRRR